MPRRCPARYVALDIHLVDFATRHPRPACLEQKGRLWEVVVRHVDQKFRITVKVEVVVDELVHGHTPKGVDDFGRLEARGVGAEERAVARRHVVVDVDEFVGLRRLAVEAHVRGFDAERRIAVRQRRNRQTDQRRVHALRDVNVGKIGPAVLGLG